MDISKYTEAKAGGSVSITHSGDGVFTIISKSYDPLTGEALDDSLTQIDTSEIQKQLDYYVAQAANLQLLVTDCMASV